MKKFLLSGVAFLLGISAANAQDAIFDNPDNRAYFGVRLGIDIACPTKVTQPVEFEGHFIEMKTKAFKTGGGFSIGGIYNRPIFYNFYVEPGLNFYYNAYNFNNNWYGETKGSIRKFGMRIPVMLGYHFDFTDDIKVYVFTGPELEIGFTAKQHTKTDNISSYYNVYSKEGYMQRADVLWDFGAGVSYQKYYVGISGGIGMCNMSKNAHGVSFHENRASITFGYNF